MSEMQTAQTILAQLGGSKFIAMTGAHTFSGSAFGLSFQLPQAGPKKVRGVRVKLTGNDLYHMEFLSWRGTKVNVVDSHEGLYADNLQDVFTEVTGLDTHL